MSAPPPNQGYSGNMADAMNTFLGQTTTLLKESQQPDAAVQKEVQRKLDEWSKLPEFNYSLMCILANPSGVDETTRSLSCLLLKNNIRKHLHTFPDDLKEFIKQKSLELLTDSSPLIRATIGILIVNIAATLGLFTWNELLPFLGQLLNSPQVEIVESAFMTIHRLCEDLAHVFTSDTLSKTLEAMLPRFMEFFQPSKP